MQAVRPKKTHPNLILQLAALLLAAVAVVSPGIRAGAGQAAPAGTSLKMLSPAQETCFPLDSRTWRISDAYGWRDDPFTGEKTFHRGVDLACAEGTPVLAGMSGVVVSARNSTSYGNVVRLCHSGGQETVYAHMQYLYVRAGEVVQAGQPLGTVGQTGRATGAHLHLEFYRGGIAYDPAKLLDERVTP